MKARSLAALLAVCVASPIAAAQPDLGDHDAQIVAYLHAIDQLDIAMGRVAMQNGGPAVRVAAGALVTDHANADRQLLAFAKSRGMVVTPLAPDAAGLAATAEARMQALRGPDFDLVFLDVMPDAAAAELEAVDDAIATARDPRLEAILHGIESHLKSDELSLQSAMR